MARKNSGWGQGFRLEVYGVGSRILSFGVRFLVLVSHVELHFHATRCETAKKVEDARTVVPAG